MVSRHLFVAHLPLHDLGDCLRQARERRLIDEVGLAACEYSNPETRARTLSEPL